MIRRQIFAPACAKRRLATGGTPDHRGPFCPRNQMSEGAIPDAEAVEEPVEYGPLLSKPRPEGTLEVRGGKTVYARNYGCTANTYDFEIILAYLLGEGYRVVEDLASADIFLLNTCAVKGATENKILSFLHSLRETGKPIIIAGCLPKINLSAIRRVIPDYAALLDPYSVASIPLALDRVRRGERGCVFFRQRPEVKARLPRVRVNRLVEIAAIADGCTGACSFCCVRFARGKLFSFPKELILKNVENAAREGVKEVWVTGQDTGAYGLDIGTNLAELLEEMCEIEGRFMIRVGMMNPNHLLKLLPRLLQVYENEKIFKFLHVPVQSGDDEVLRRMRRPYSADVFRRVVSAFRERFPDLTLATDIICGFPSETEEAFERTLELVEETEPDVVNISQFSPRPGTEAARMKELFLHTSVVKERSRKATELAKKMALKRNFRWVGRTGEILIDEVGRFNTYVGRNFAYKPTVVDASALGDALGTFIRVRFVDACVTHLKAEVLS